MLGKGGFGNGQILGEVAAIATALPGKQLQDVHTHRMPHSFGKAGYLFLFFTDLFLHIFNFQYTNLTIFWNIS